MEKNSIKLSSKEYLNLNFANSLLEHFTYDIYTIYYTKNELTIVIAPESVYQIIFFLKKHSTSKYEVLTDMTCVDYPEREYRFDLIYNLLSIKYNSRIRIKTVVDSITSIESITPIYKAANWFEREVFDMFGIFFLNNTDLRRILTDYGFTYHPLRKDFPLSGYEEIRYDETTKQVVSEKLELPQNYRYFDLNSSWSKNLNDNSFVVVDLDLDKSSN
jgi:NADH dehydrogenase (ubiquinone) Fe-S protein 3